MELTNSQLVLAERLRDGWRLTQEVGQESARFIRPRFKPRQCELGRIDKCKEIGLLIETRNNEGGREWALSSDGMAAIAKA